jgi:DNA ligase-1
MVSPKLDGYRCIVHEGVALSRNLKPFPNEMVQAYFGNPSFNGFDGELIVGSPTEDGVWNRSAGVMKKGTEPDVVFYPFDMIVEGMGFQERYLEMIRRASASATNFPRIEPVRIAPVPHYTVHTPEELMEREDAFVSRGYEGIMIRSLNGAYKYGRSTVREGGLLKYKRWHDMEARVVGVVEQMANTNEATKDALGRTKRSSAKAGKVGKSTMGALLVEFDAHAGTPLRSLKMVQFELGTGYDDKMRAWIWNNQQAVIGQIVTFKYQSLGVEGAPRFPVFKGFRDVLDLALTDE